MADETTEQTAEKAAPLEGGAKKNLMVFGVMLLVTIAVGAGGGMFAAKLANGGGSATTKDAPATKPAGEHEEEMASVKLPAIIANLNEPKMQRYIHVVIILGVTKENQSAVSDLVAKRKEEIKNWLVTYLSNLSMEEVRGATNLNRIQREILDMVNEHLFPNQKPRISRVLFEEFQVQ